jgi:putative transposase
MGPGGLHRWDDVVGIRPTRSSASSPRGTSVLGGGMELDEVCRRLEIAESTWHRWTAQYGGMKANDAKRLKELEVENTRLKKLLAEAELDKAMLKEIAEGNF